VIAAAVPGRRLAGRRCVITGASRGIGAAIARVFASEGATLGLTARTGVDLARLADELRAVGATVAWAVADIAIAAEVNRAAAELRAALGPFDTVVNNAGIVVRKPTHELTDDEWRRMMAVNLDGPFYVTRAFAADLRASRGRLINIASIAGRQGTPLLASYCASKHGLVGLTRAVAEEWRGEVAVNAICPGSVDTDMLRQGMPGAPPAMTADDVAAAALFLAAEAPAAMTGSCLDVFG
jgi:NAD(P)-dependent dehydrogenase (short-subunit alcohol dehydrogenase family)